MKKIILSILFLFLSGITFLYVKGRGEDAIFLLPKGYEGGVITLFGVPNGVPIEYEEGKRIYRIPKTGILRTQFSMKTGRQTHEFFYIDSLGNRIEILQLWKLRLQMNESFIGKSDEYIDQLYIKMIRDTTKSVIAPTEGYGVVGDLKYHIFSVGRFSKLNAVGMQASNMMFDLMDELKKERGF